MTLDPTLLAIGFAILAALAAGGLFYALAYEKVDNQRSNKRVQHIASQPSRVARQATREQSEVVKKRRTIANKLKQSQEIINAKAELADTSKASLDVRLMRSGLNWDVKTFWLMSLGMGGVIAFLLFLAQAPLFAVIGSGFVGTFGLPRWYVSYATKKRQNAFLTELPNALDVIVRGLKAGLPVNDCLGIISREAKEPVRGEFRRMVETMQLGVPLTEAAEKLYTRIPIAEVNFLAIMLMIQATAGGNLGETLSNLSRVVRERRKMSAKIQAMSMEAKASASIIGALPICVMTLVYLTTPDYITLLFTETLGNIMLGVCAFWMLTGILVMRKMINFDF